MENRTEKNIRLVALDLDETTLRTGGNLSEYTRHALEEADRNGIQIVAASGRAFSALPKAVTDLPFVEYAIASNGANIYEVKTGKRVMAKFLEKEAADRILDIAREEGLLVEGFIDGVPYSQRNYVEDTDRLNRTGRNARYVQSTRRPVEDIFAFLRQAECLDSVNLLVEEQERKPAVRKRVEEVKGIYLTTSADVLLETANKDAGKGPALRELAKMLRIDREEIAAFGNAENDIDMIRFAGTGIAVANAAEEVRAAADEVTESNDEDGVARWIMRYLGK